MVLLYLRFNADISYDYYKAYGNFAICLTHFLRVSSWLRPFLQTDVKNLTSFICTYAQVNPHSWQTDLAIVVMYNYLDLLIKWLHDCSCNFHQLSPSVPGLLL